MDVGDRSQSEVLSVVLLFGLVIVTAAVMLLVGVQAIEEVRGSVDIENDINAMREVDSRLSRVAYNDNVVETLDFGSRPGEIGNRVEVDNSSYMNVTVNKEFAQCSATIEMGALEREAQNGEIVAYEGGGVWRRPDNGNASTMVSPPDFQYQNGTINFPLVSVNGSIGGSGDQLLAKKNVTESRQRSREINRQLSQGAACESPTNLTIEVNSTYYRAWARYFEQVTPADATVYHTNETATITLATRGDPTDADIDVQNLTADVPFVAEIKVLATAGSVPSNASWNGVSDSDFGVGSDSDAHAEINDPYSLRIRVNGTVYTPWTDAPAQGKSHPDWNNPVVFPRDDVNRPPKTGDAVVRVEVPANETIAAEMAIHNCEPGGGYSDPGSWTNLSSGPSDYEVGDHSGHRYYQYQCDRSDWGRIANDTQVQANSADSSDNNLVPLIDEPGNRDLPGNLDDKDYQPTLNDILGSRGLIDTSVTPREVVLDDNQAIYVYELSNEVSGSPSASGEDFNDGVVLINFYEQGNVAATTSFSLKISTSQVKIQDD
jgi:hypothetical protein